jgi:hypothetical protein
MSSGVGAALGNAGAGHYVEFRGKQYAAKLVVQKIKTHMERRLQQQARKTVCALEGHISPEAFDRQLRALNDDIDGGKYFFAGDAARLAMATNPETIIALVACLFDVEEAFALEMIAEKGAEIKSVLDLVIRESFPPNAEAEATAP